MKYKQQKSQRTDNMKIIIYLICTHLIIRPTATFLNSNELKISIDLISKLEIRNCILVGNSTNENLTFQLKNFSSAKVPNTFLDYYSFVKYADSLESVYYRTGVTFKEDDLYILEAITQAFQKV